jgi:hypothetical protein
VAIASGAGGTGRSSLLNLGVAGVQSASGTRVRVGAVDLRLSAGESGSAVFELGAAGQEVPGTSYRLHLVSRDLGTRARGVGEAVLLVFRDRGDAEVAIGAVDNRIGDGFGTADRPYRVRAAVNADGAQLTVAVANASDRAVQIGLELM